MRCPRCDASQSDDAIRCDACGVPLRIPDEPQPARLDRSLQLDRRRLRAPTPAPVAAAHAATVADFAPSPVRATEPGMQPDVLEATPAERDEADFGDILFEPEVTATDGAALADDPDAADGAFAVDVDVTEWTHVAGAEGAGAVECGPEAWDDAPTEPDGDGDAIVDEDGDDDGFDEPGRAAVDRGRLLSLASLALASAAALVAVLTSL